MDGFMIDSVEVSRARYLYFLSDEPPQADDADCSWNTDRKPKCEWLETENINLPANCLNWCDARDYCLWAGKRLCEGDWRHRDQDEWQRACSSNGIHAYPYGDDYESMACNGLDFGKRRPTNVALLPTCRVGSLDLFDMSGNLIEWTGVCEGTHGEDTSCRLRGGSYANPADVLRCDYDFGADDPRSMANELIGFRCCKDLETATDGDQP